MEYLAGGKRLLWSGQTVLSGDTLSDGRQFNCSCDFHLPYLYIPDIKHRLQKTLFVGKNDWLKNRLFFITENIMGILNRLYAELMHRSHDFLSWTLAIVGATSSRCYFLRQCQCLLVCVLCVLVVRCVKSQSEWIRRDFMYYYKFRTCSLKLFKSFFKFSVRKRSVKFADFQIFCLFPS